MLIVKYDRHGQTISDFCVVSKVKDATYKVSVLDDEIELHYANETVIDIVSIAIKSGHIPSSKVKIFVEDIEIRLSADGSLLDNLPFSIDDIICRGYFPASKEESDIFKNF